MPGHVVRDAVAKDLLGIAGDKRRPWHVRTFALKQLARHKQPKDIVADSSRPLFELYRDTNADVSVRSAAFESHMELLKASAHVGLKALESVFGEEVAIIGKDLETAKQEVQALKIAAAGKGSADLSQQVADLKTRLEAAETAFGGVAAALGLDSDIDNAAPAAAKARSIVASLGKANTSLGERAAALRNLTATVDQVGGYLLSAIAEAGFDGSQLTGFREVVVASREVLRRQAANLTAALEAARGAVAEKASAEAEKQTAELGRVAELKLKEQAESDRAEAVRLKVLAEAEALQLRAENEALKASIGILGGFDYPKDGLEVSKKYILDGDSPPIFLGHIFALLTSKAGRDHNEDTAGYMRLPDGREIFVVCDGAGGHAAGEAASRIGVDTYLEARRSGIDILFAVQEANKLIVLEASRNPLLAGMASTLVALEIDRVNNKISIVNVGDSRAKTIDAAGSLLLTRDHHYKWDIYEADNPDKLTSVTGMPDAFVDEVDKTTSDNIIVSAIGANPEINGETAFPDKVSLITIPFEEAAIPTKLLLYSDGLVDNTTETAVTAAVNSAASPTELVEAAMSAATRSGTTDNVTVAGIIVNFNLLMERYKLQMFERDEDTGKLKLIQEVSRSTIAPVAAAKKPAPAVQAVARSVTRAVARPVARAAAPQRAIIDMPAMAPPTAQAVAKSVSRPVVSTVRVVTTSDANEVVSGPNFGLVTDIGKRKTNQDKAGYLSTDKMEAWVVCDGMGAMGKEGKDSGSTASKTVMDKFLEEMAKDSSSDIRKKIIHAVKSSAMALADAVSADPDLANMGTTLSAIIHDKENSKIYVVNCGDSSVKMVDATRSRYLTMPHHGLFANARPDKREHQFVSDDSLSAESFTKLSDALMESFAAHVDRKRRALPVVPVNEFREANKVVSGIIAPAKGGTFRVPQIVDILEIPILEIPVEEGGETSLFVGSDGVENRSGVNFYGDTWKESGAAFELTETLRAATPASAQNTAQAIVLDAIGKGSIDNVTAGVVVLPGTLELGKMKVTRLERSKTGDKFTPKYAQLQLNEMEPYDPHVKFVTVETGWWLFKGQLEVKVVSHNMAIDPRKVATSDPAVLAKLAEGLLPLAAKGKKRFEIHLASNVTLDDIRLFLDRIKFVLGKKPIQGDKVYIFNVPGSTDNLSFEVDKLPEPWKPAFGIAPKPPEPKLFPVSAPAPVFDIGTNAGQHTLMFQIQLSDNIVAAIAANERFGGSGHIFVRPEIPAAAAQRLGRPEMSGKPGAFINIKLDPKKKMILIGDLHGSNENLERLKQKYGQGLVDGSVVLMFLGDSIHPAKGDLADVSGSVAVIDGILEMMANYPDNVFYIKGNHDEVTSEDAKMFVKGQQKVQQGLLFRAECDARRPGYGNKLQEFFDKSPLLSIIEANGKIRVLTGHIPVEVDGIDFAQAVSASIDPVLNVDLRWNDPDHTRGVVGKIYKPKDLTAMRKKLGLPKDTYIVGGHIYHPTDRAASSYIPFSGERHVLLQGWKPSLEVFVVDGATGKVRIEKVDPLSLMPTPTPKVKVAVAASVPATPKAHQTPAPAVARSAQPNQPGARPRATAVPAPTQNAPKPVDLSPRDAAKLGTKKTSNINTYKPSNKPSRPGEPPKLDSCVDHFTYYGADLDAFVREKIVSALEAARAHTRTDNDPIPFNINLAKNLSGQELEDHGNLLNALFVELQSQPRILKGQVYIYLAEKPDNSGQCLIVMDETELKKRPELRQLFDLDPAYFVQPGPAI